MTNKEIAKQFQLLGKIMELHGENPFKIRSYSNAYLTLRAFEKPLSEIPVGDLENIKGIGKAISGKIQELLVHGKMEALEKYKAKTPAGLQEMLLMKGFGPKKIKAVWDELGIESAGELLYAVHENRLADLKGFGKKTQEDLKVQLTYFLKSRHHFLYADLHDFGLQLLEKIKAKLLNAQVEWTGALRRRANVLEQVELIIGCDAAVSSIFDSTLILEKESEEGVFEAISEDIPVRIYHYPLSNFGSKQFLHTGTSEFLKAFTELYPGIDFKNLPNEQAIFEKINRAFIVPELREGPAFLQKNPDLVEEKDIKGVLHVHTTYSDGQHSLRDMCTYARDLGYQYIGITDHSKSAFYANGLSPQRVMEQFKEIDALNQELAPFKIYKGIESDILSNGDLDYEEDLLKQFDFIIASIHSGLKMDKEKATQRLIKAIENKYTTILGHMTGRLLLSRPGYPVDHEKVIDACAANNVAIELNANPRRLDMDWQYIDLAIQKGVKIAINPDAHSKEGIHDIKFGVYSARKGGLTPKGLLFVDLMI